MNVPILGSLRPASGGRYPTSASAAPTLKRSASALHFGSLIGEKSQAFSSFCSVSTNKYSPNSVTLMNSIFCDWSHPSPSCRISIYSLYKYCPCIPNIFFGGTQGCLISEFTHPSARPRTWWWPQSTSLWKPRRGAAVPTKARRSCGF